MTNLISPSKAVESILAKVRAQYIFEPDEVRAYQESAPVYAELLARMTAMSAGEKVACLERFDELGATLSTSSEDGAPILAPYIGNRPLIAGLVGFLGDKETKVRDEASRQILLYVPDMFIRNHVPEVLEKVVAQPQTSRAAQLLAKTGAEKALSIIRSNSAIREESEAGTRMSLAKLGDSLAEDTLLQMYRKEEDPRDKAELALDLGFVASPKTILALARDLRIPLTYAWNQTAQRSFRIHVIEGLSRAYPMERIFWKPEFTPSDDSFYQAIEDWTRDKLGVKWDIPRPPFLYQISVPMAAPRR